MIDRTRIAEIRARLAAADHYTDVLCNASGEPKPVAFLLDRTKASPDDPHAWPHVPVSVATAAMIAAAPADLAWCLAEIERLGTELLIARSSLGDPDVVAARAEFAAEQRERAETVEMFAVCEEDYPVPLALFRYLEDARQFDGSWEFIARLDVRLSPDPTTLAEDDARIEE